MMFYLSEVGNTWMVLSSQDNTLGWMASSIHSQICKTGEQHDEHGAYMKYLAGIYYITSLNFIQLLQGIIK